MYLLLRRAERRGLVHAVLNVLALDVEVLELLLELVHHLKPGISTSAIPCRETNHGDFLHVHRLERLVHAPDNVCHARRHRAHADGGLNARCHGIYP